MTLWQLTACWAGALVVVGTFTVALARSAALAEKAERERLAAPRVNGERRTGPPDRRSEARPWSTASPGRRREDMLRAEVGELRQALREAEQRLAQAEAESRRRSA